MMLDELKRKAEAAAAQDCRGGIGWGWKEDFHELGHNLTDAAYLANARPDVVLRLIAVAQAAKNVSDEVGEDYTDADWQCVWKAISALREALQALETK